MYQSSATTTAHNKRFNNIYELGGFDTQLQINLSTTQPEEIRIKFLNRFIQNNLKSTHRNSQLAQDY